MVCFLWQHEIYLWYLPGTVCLYSGPSPVDLACLRNHLLHAWRYWYYYGCHPQDTAVGRDITHYSFSSIRAVVYGFSSNMRSKLVCLRRIIRAFICIFYATHTTYFHAYSYDTYILVVRCMKQNKDAVWSLVYTTFSYWGACWSKVLVLIWYHMYVRGDCYFWFFIEMFHFFSRYLVL